MNRLNLEIERVAKAAIAAKVFPGCTVGYVRGGQSVVLPFGRYGYEVSHPEAAADTVYDVASITKSIPTGAVIMKLIEENRLDLETKISEILPEIQNTYREEIRLKHLLTYTVVLDLPQGLAEISKQGADKLMETLFRAPLKARPGDGYFYTNAPAILLGLVAERVAGKPLDTLADEWFFKPMAMGLTTFHPEQLPVKVIAPTEIDARGEVRGAVHDEAAWTLRQAGRIAGNAGLFSTAGDLLKFAGMLLAEGEYGGKRYFKPETVRLMHTNQIAGLGESAGLGWELNQPRFMGEAASPQTFGKTGFTGCVILMDPVCRAAMVLLSNRTYPHRPASRDAINAVRRELADLIFA